MRQEFIPGDYDVTRKHSVVPLPVLSKNEQCYTDVIQILDSYEETVAEIFKASGKVFGDQLTRERFSGAKRLRKDAITEEERFEHLSPITFELFHLQMTLLTMFYKLLYKKDSFEKGTLHGEKIRLSRTEANGDDVKNHFDHCKELAVSLIDSYIVSAALEYFGMDKLDSVPSKNVILSSDESSEYEKKMSLVHSLDKFIDVYIIKDSKALLQEQTLPLQFIQIQV